MFQGAILLLEIVNHQIKLFMNVFFFHYSDKKENYFDFPFVEI